jgi:hypothetical protein
MKHSGSLGVIGMLASVLLPLSCISRKFFNDSRSSVAQLQEPEKDPIQQLIKWEVGFNLPMFQYAVRTDSKVEIESTRVPRDRANIRWFGQDPGSVKRFIEIAGVAAEVRWPKHPANTVSSVPFFAQPSDPALSFQGHYSASRSMFVLLDDGSAFSIKLPSGSPHAKTNSDVAKDDLASELRLIPILTEHFRDSQKQKTPRADLVLLLEIGTVSEKETGNGFSIRDYRPLQRTRNFYLPAFSLHHVATAMYQSCTGVSQQPDPAVVQKYWMENYLAAVGRAKAALLLDYGLFESTPHGQNWLIELKAGNFCPTGRMVFRDIADTKPVITPARLLGYESFVAAWTAEGGVPRNSVDLKRSQFAMVTDSPLFANVGGAAEQAQLSGFLQVLGAPFLSQKQRQVSAWVKENLVAFGYPDTQAQARYPEPD